MSSWWFGSRGNDPKIVSRSLPWMVMWMSCLLLVNSSPTSGSTCSVVVIPTGGGSPFPECFSSPCSWNDALTWCAKNSTASTLSWEFLLKSGEYIFPQNARGALTLRTPGGINSVVVKSFSSSDVVIWSGSSSLLSIGGHHQFLTIQVSGITFSRNASLSILSNSSASVVVENAVFEKSFRKRPLLISSYGEITIKNSHFLYNSKGGAASIQGGNGTILIQGCTFSNNSLENGSGGGLLLQAKFGNVFVVSCSFFQNQAIGFGVSPSTCASPSSDSTGCGGGGLALFTRGNVLVANSSFVYNNASDFLTNSGHSGGGGLWISSGSTRVQNSSFSGNIAKNNGGISSGSNGGGCGWIQAMTGNIHIDTILAMNNTAIENGRGGGGRGTRGSGGGCFKIVSLRGSIFVRGGSYFGNKAIRNGWGSMATINGDGNGGWGNGGGALWMWIESNGNIVVEGGKYYWNRALQNGQGGSLNDNNGAGGFYNGGGALWMTAFRSSSASVIGTEMMYNVANENGQGGSKNYRDGDGGSENGGGAIWMVSVHSFVNISNSTMNFNQAVANGRGGSNNRDNGHGGNLNGGGAVWMHSPNSFTLVQDSKFLFNEASMNGEGGTANINANGGSQNGGGAVWMRSRFSSTNVDHSHFLYNTASGNGWGGLACTSLCIGGNLNGGGGLFALSNTKRWSTKSFHNLFILNVASDSGRGRSSSTNSLASGGTLCGGGAAVLVNTAMFQSTFIDNHALNPGVASINSSIGADGTNNGGGAVLAQTTLLQSCMFRNNTITAGKLSSAGSGGAARLVSNCAMFQCSFDLNSASFRGGALASGSGTENVVMDSNFTRNHALFDGGAAVVDTPNSLLSVTSSRFIRNLVRVSRGGALAVVAFFATIHTESCIFSQNEASGEGGAIAVVVEGGKHESSGDIFTENHARTFGGVLFSTSSSFSSEIADQDIRAANIFVQNALFLNNSAGFGGVAMTDNRGTATISSSRALRNRATSVSGGFAHLTVRSMMNLTNLLLVDNSAVVTAGSIYQEHFSVLRVRNVSFVNSTSSSNGAVECVHDTVAYFSEGTRFEGNRALTDSTGALYIEGNAYAFLSDVSFVRNRATSFSGALSAYDTSRLVLDHCSFIGNRASAFGGAFSLFGSSFLHILSGSSCIQNVAMGGAGGCGWVSASAQLIVSDSQFTSNSALQGDGGALSVSTTVAWQVSNSSFSGNQAWRGGALSFNLSSIWSALEVIVLQSSIRSSEFSNNIAFRPLPSELSNENNLLGSGGGGALFFNLPSQSSASIASLAWSSWTLKNIFSGNSAVYGPSVASVGLSPFVETSQGRIVSSCQPISSFQSFRQIVNASSLVQTMPGVTVSLRLGICDAFGQPISTVIGATLGQRFNQSTSEQIVQTATNGTGVWQSSLPPLIPGNWFALSSSLIGVGEGLSFPRLVLSWPASNCAPFFGRSTSSGCTVCSSSEYSISSSNLPCQLCSQLTVGAVCESQPLSKVLTSYSSTSVSLLSEADSLTVTVVRMDSGYWPSLQVFLPVHVASVVPLVCPFDFCSRGEVDFFVTGVDASSSFVTVSNPSLMCQEGSFRDPSSILCGECLEGYSEWNHICYQCPNGPQPAYVILFIFQLVGWTLLQFILAQKGGNGNLAAVLIFLTQSLAWFTYPSGSLQTAENLVNFRFHIPGVSQCYIDVDPSTQLFLRALLPFLYFLTLWVMYLFHRMIAWCLQGRQQSSILSSSFADSKKTESDSTCNRFLTRFSRKIVQTASTSPYFRATALLILGTYPAILNAVFSVWSCQDVPVGSSLSSVVSLTPSVQCGTQEYWLWNLFYIPIVVLLLGVIVLVVFATRKSRDATHKSLHTTLLGLEETNSEIKYVPRTVLEKFGMIWRSAFRDEVPWWTAVELFIRLVMIAIFSLTATRISSLTNLLLAFTILGWIIVHYHFSPYHDKTTDRLVVVAQFSMLVMAMTGGTNLSASTRIIIIYCVFGFSAVLIGYRILSNLFRSIRSLVRRSRSGRGSSNHLDSSFMLTHSLHELPLRKSELQADSETNPQSDD